MKSYYILLYDNVNIYIYKYDIVSYNMILYYTYQIISYYVTFFSPAGAAKNLPLTAVGPALLFSSSKFNMFKALRYGGN